MSTYQEMVTFLKNSGMNMNVATSLLNAAIAADVAEVAGQGTAAATNQVYTPSAGQVYNQFTVLTDAQLLAANIKYGHTIFGVASTYIAPVYSVSFATAGGNAAPETQFLSENALVIAPTEPTKAGFVFGGWSADAGVTIWDFATMPITEATTLTAVWTAE